MNDINQLPLTATHWGVYRAKVTEGKLQALYPFEKDDDPSPIGQGYVDVLDDPLRIKAPMVRKSWLQDGPGAATDQRGQEGFVQVDWDTAESLVAKELHRIRSTYGNQAIFGGSYGWASAGRFHHAQSQLHRFLNCIGGYTRSVNSYSLAGGEVILSHILGDIESFIHSPTPWEAVIQHTDLLIAFGGMPLRNSQVSSGGTGCHRARKALAAACKDTLSIVNISPISQDVAAEFGAAWLSNRPGSDVAIMLGLAHELIRCNWVDKAFIDRYTYGFDAFADYLTGKTDDIAKTAAWAAKIANIPEVEITSLAEQMHRSRTVISVSWSLTRQEHGEQPFWMATTLAAMLGQIGLPGGGITFGYCAANSIGNEKICTRYAALPQLDNPVQDFIPVARISDMLLHPDTSFQFNGDTLSYPDIRMIYWAGGNPFHHHQDLTRLSAAWQKPETIIVHDWCWNATAKRADIVLPCTTPLERNDLMITPRDRFIVRMQQLVSAIGEARNDYDIFCNISRRLGLEEKFSENKSTDQWIEWIYKESQALARQSDLQLPTYDAFLANGWHETDRPSVFVDAFTEFRHNPQQSPLHTPSGKIEITSMAIASMKDMPVKPYPCWYEPKEWLGNADSHLPFHLISSQPPDKLHSQLDHGTVSKSYKKHNRSELGIHPKDAQDLGVTNGDTVRVYNDRGACLATVQCNDGLLCKVVQISTGAWLDAITQNDGTLLCRHGNPNTLTRDAGTSLLAQGPTALSCLVAIEPYDHTAPVEAFIPPTIETRSVF